MNAGDRGIVPVWIVIRSSSALMMDRSRIVQDKAGSDGDGRKSLQLEMRRDFPVRTDECGRSEMGERGHAARLRFCGGERSSSSAAEIRSTMRMVPPQHGQHQVELCRVGETAFAGGACSLARSNSWKQMGSRLARRRLARKPKWRMRTKRRGSRCSRKRRRNSSTGSVISFFLLPWAESRQRKVTLPSSRATSLWFDMATRWV